MGGMGTGTSAACASGVGAASAMNYFAWGHRVGTFVFGALTGLGFAVNLGVWAFSNAGIGAGVGAANQQAALACGGGF